jgi:hypothetical protein
LLVNVDGKAIRLNGYVPLIFHKMKQRLMKSQEPLINIRLTKNDLDFLVGLLQRHSSFALSTEGRLTATRMIQTLQEYQRQNDSGKE